MMYKMSYFFLVFFIYSIIGYLVEVICVSLNQKKIVFSRGYLIGPYLPIFGAGSLIITLFLWKYREDVLALFVMAMVSCCVLEYFTSLILEKIFKLRWWDYSEKKFNLNGRICLETGVLFGIGGIFIIKVTNPLIFMLFECFSKTALIAIAIFSFVVMLADFILSTFTIFKLKIDTSKFINMDATRVVKDEVRKSLRRYRYLYKRFLEAFPALTTNSNFSKIRAVVSKKIKFKREDLVKKNDDK